MNLWTLADDLTFGHIEVWQIPTWAQHLYYAGYTAGVREGEASFTTAVVEAGESGFRAGLEACALEAGCTAEVALRLARAEAEADHWYEVAHNPGRQLSRSRLDRIDQALDTAWQAGEPLTVDSAVRAAESPRRPAA